MKKIVKMKDWDFGYVAAYGDPYLCLTGRLLEPHPRLGDRGDHRMITSPIVKIDWPLIETKNTIYELTGEKSVGMSDTIARERGIAVKSIGELE